MGLKQDVVQVRLADESRRNLLVIDSGYSNTKCVPPVLPIREVKNEFAIYILFKAVISSIIS
jgi:hypothetical protein